MKTQEIIREIDEAILCLNQLIAADTDTIPVAKQGIVRRLERVKEMLETH
jgi:hypothetical protein